PHENAPQAPRSREDPAARPAVRPRCRLSWPGRAREEISSALRGDQHTDVRAADCVEHRKGRDPPEPPKLTGKERYVDRTATFRGPFRAVVASPGQGHCSETPVEPAAIKTLTWPDASSIMTCRVVSERLHRRLTLGWLGWGAVEGGALGHGGRR